MTSLAPWLLTVALGTTIRADHDDVDVAAARQKFTQSCGGAARTSDACRELRSQLETALLDGMMASLQAGEQPPASAVQVALAADVPALRVLGLRLAPEATRASAAVAALDSPYASVREQAAELLRSAGSESQRRMLERRPSSSRSVDPVADTPPDAARLGVKPYPNASYRFAFSGPEQAYFGTADAPEKVVAFYAQGGRKSYSAAELQQAMKARAASAMDQSKMMQMIQQAQARGEDPAKAMMVWQKSLAGLGADPTRDFEGRPGVVSPRYVPADDLFSRVVVVFRDELVGATAIVVPLPRQGAEPGVPDGEDVTQTISRQQFQARPILDAPPPE